MRLFLLLMFLLSSNSVWAWYKPNKKYYAFNINEEGVYKIKSSFVNSKKLQAQYYNFTEVAVFCNGEQVPIYIKDLNNDNVFNNSDYILFYAKNNDNWLDKKLYKNSETLFLKNSLFNEKAKCFYTIVSAEKTKRLSIQKNPNVLPTKTTNSVYSEKIISYEENYFSGKLSFSQTPLVEYQSGEGWVSEAIKNSNKKYSYKLENLDESYSGFLKMSLGLHSYNNNSTEIEIFANKKNKKISLAPYDFKRESFEININDINNKTIELLVDNSKSSNSSVLSISEIYFKYPSIPSIEKKTFFKLYDNKVEQVLNLNGVTPEDVVIDINNNEKIIPLNNKIIFLPKSDRNIIVQKNNIIQEISSLEEIEFTDYKNTNKDYEYIIITSKLLETSSSEYQKHLISEGFATLLVYVEDLYNQYSYGIEKHPLAIKYFLDSAFLNWSVKPKYVLLIGKSISNNIKSEKANNLVPTFGYPPSDNLYATNNVFSNDTLKFSVGRISATTNEEVLNYLSKVQEYRKTSSDKWKKNMFHFGGGNNFNEQNLFSNYLNSYKIIAEKPILLANVYTQLKTSSANFDLSLSTSLLETIKNGIGIMNFFGHGTANGFEQNLDEINNYENKGKYPILIANSCYVGNFHGVEKSDAEKFVLAKDKGMIMFFSTTNLSDDVSLNHFNNNFYKNINTSSYGSSIGKVIKKTNNEFKKNNYYKNNFNDNVANVYTLFSIQGDPSIIYFNSDKPDYEIDNILFNKSNISIDDDSIKIKFDLINNGIYNSSLVKIEIERTIENSPFLESKTIMVSTNKHSSSIEVSFKIDGLSQIGNNFFSININKDRTIDESTYKNNLKKTSIFVNRGDFYLIHPTPSSIIPKDSTRLIIFTNIYEKDNQNFQYIIELDTSFDFNSDYKKTYYFKKFNEGSIITQKVSELIENKIYFWRVKKNLENYTWKNSSFIYEKNISGWQQKSFGQYYENNKLNILFDNKEKSITYNPISRNLYVKASFNNITNNPEESAWGLNGTTLGLGVGNGVTKKQPHINIVVIDPISLNPWKNNEYFFQQNPIDISGEIHKTVFSFFSNNNTEQGRIIQMLEKIPNNYYYIIYSHNNPNYSLWSNEFINTMKTFGLKVAANSLNEKMAFVVFGKKNVFSKYVISKTTNKPLVFNDVIVSKDTEGTLKTFDIGPSKKWTEIDFDIKKEKGQSFEISLFGIDDNLNKIKLKNYQEITTNIKKKIDPNDEINNYKTIRAEVILRDTINRNVPKINKLRIEYSNMPHLVLDTKKLLDITNSIFINSTFNFNSYVTNISDIKLDSTVNISYYFKNISNKLEINTGGSDINNINSLSSKLIQNSFFVKNSSFFGENIFKVSFKKNKNYYLDINNYFFPVFVNSLDINSFIKILFDKKTINNYETIKKNALIELEIKKFYSKINNLKAIIINNKSKDTLHSSIIDFKSIDTLIKIKYTPNEEIEYKIIFSFYENTNKLYELSKIFRISTEKIHFSDIFLSPNPLWNRARLNINILGYIDNINYKINIYNSEGKLLSEFDNNYFGKLNVGNNNLYFDITNNNKYIISQGYYFLEIYIDYIDKKTSTKANKRIIKKFMVNN